jgi:hypothetical protein
MGSAAWLWFSSAFLPLHIDLGVDSRMGIVAVHPAFERAIVFPWVALAALVAFLFLLGTSLRRGLESRRLQVAGGAFLFGLAYTAILVFLRAGPRGITEGLARNSYYAYIFNLAALICMGALVDFRLLPAGWTGRLPRVVLGLALVMITATSAYRVHTQGKAEVQWGKPALVLQEQIRKLHEADGSTDDFTFRVAADHPGEQSLPYVGKSRIDGRPITFSQVLFPRYYSRRSPRYVLWRRFRGFDVVGFDGRVLGIPRNGWPVDLHHLSAKEEARFIIGRTPAEVERRIASAKRGRSRSWVKASSRP